MNNEGLSPIVQTISSLLFPLTLIFAFYIILFGHVTPGGGFQGGAVGASAVVMLIVAFGAKKIHDKMNHDNMSIFESTGGLIFILTGLIGLLVASTFLSNFLVGEFLFGEIPAWGSNTGVLNSGGILPILNIAVGMKVIGGLSAVVLLMALTMEGKKK
jgi:multicomponent Na+:H+ antiporter subunit B